MWHDADDDLDDDEFPDQADDGQDDETVPCPHCRKSVYEDAERCPNCGNYLSREDRPWRRPAWLLAGVAIGLILVAYWTLR